MKRIFEVFAVDNLDDIFGLKAKEMELPYYYCKSEKVVTNLVDILSWKYYCYYLSKNDESALGYFDKNNVDSLAKGLNMVFKDNSETVKKTGEVLNKFGR